MNLKLCLKLLVIFLSSVVFAADIRIVEVSVGGNATLTQAEILAKVTARPGQIFSNTALTQDTEKLAKLPAVQYAYYSADIVDGGVAVKFIVVERLLISEISFFGNKKIKDSTLKKLLSLKKGDYLDKVTLAKALDDVRNKFEEKGFYFAKVELDGDAVEQGKIIFRIEEGPKIKIGNVRYEGNTVFTEKQLDSVIKLDSKVLFVISKSYDNSKVEADIEEILHEYRQAGYVEASCQATPEFNEKLNRANIVYQITEGSEYRIVSHAVTGASFFSEEQLQELIIAKTGMPYYSENVKKSADNIRDKYRENGFIEATVTPIRKYEQSTELNIVYKVNEGKRFKIGLIEVTGNYETHDKVIRRELDYSGFKPGRWYNAKEATGQGEGTIEKEIKQATLASDVFITHVDGSDEDTKNAIVNITEGMTGMVMFGAGVDSSNGVIGQIVVEQRNFNILDWPESFDEFFRGKAFRGAGQNMRISLEPGTEVNRYSIDFTDPYAWDRPLALNLGMSKYYRGRECYDEERTKAYVGLTRRYEDNWSLGLRVRMENVNISDLDADSPQEIVDIKGDSQLFGTKFTIRKRETDSRFTPSKGYSFDLSYEFVVGDYDFGVVSSSFTKYKTLREDLVGRKTVLATKIYGASILGDAPAFEKFYAGGSGSLRGFEYRGISPRGESLPKPGTFDDPIGSDWIVLANAEVTVPLSSDRYNWLLFADSGIIDDNALRASIGTGIEILIPEWFGPVPMRFEIAVPLTKEDEDDTQFFSFSMGRLF